MAWPFGQHWHVQWKSEPSWNPDEKVTMDSCTCPCWRRSTKDLVVNTRSTLNTTNEIKHMHVCASMNTSRSLVWNNNHVNNAHSGAPNSLFTSHHIPSQSVHVWAHASYSIVLYTTMLITLYSHASKQLSYICSMVHPICLPIVACTTIYAIEREWSIHCSNLYTGKGMDPSAFMHLQLSWCLHC